MSKSPFAGMDPYIEACGLWESFHASLAGALYAALGDILPERYAVSQEKRFYISTVGRDGKEYHRFRPDVSVLRPEGDRAGSSSAIAVAEGEVAMEAVVGDEFREAFIDILDMDENEQLVTSIEILSPSNKVRGSAGWKKYLRKRRALLTGQANLVEIDLVRAGSRMPMTAPWPAGPYMILTSTAESAPICRVKAVGFHEPLPPLRIPLMPPDAPAVVELQPLIDAVYARSRFYRRIDYAKPLTPPLSEADERRLREVLAERGGIGS